MSTFSIKNSPGVTEFFTKAGQLHHLVGANQGTRFVSLQRCLETWEFFFETGDGDGDLSPQKKNGEGLEPETMPRLEKRRNIDPKHQFFGGSKPLIFRRCFFGNL